MASDERNGNGGLPARQVMNSLIHGTKDLKGLNERMVQVGGDATTGRGQVVFKSMGGNENA